MMLTSYYCRLGRSTLAPHLNVVAALRPSVGQYGYEIRDAKPYFEDLPEMKLPDEMVELAEHILYTKAGHFDPAEFEDRARCPTSSSRGSVCLG
jgi:hypothetical protein